MRKYPKDKKFLRLLFKAVIAWKTIQLMEAERNEKGYYWPRIRSNPRQR